MVKIIRLKETDVSEFRKLFIRIIGEGFSYYPNNAKLYILKSWTSSKIALKLATSDRLFLIARENGVALGYLIGKKYQSGLSTILWLGVLNEFRKRGIGRKLVSEWESWSIANSANRLRAATTNPENDSFYSKLGYKKSDKTWNNDWGMKQIVYVKGVPHQKST
jgi:ribosomal protein S18 acetylase RimI-like enzyme